MAKIGKGIRDGVLIAAMKECGIFTPASFHAPCPQTLTLRLLGVPMKVLPSLRLPAERSIRFGRAPTALRVSPT